MKHPRYQPTVGARSSASLNLQEISSKSLAPRLGRAGRADPSHWFCSTNPGRRRRAAPAICSESAADSRWRFVADAHADRVADVKIARRTSMPPEALDNGDIDC